MSRSARGISLTTFEVRQISTTESPGPLFAYTETATLTQDYVFPEASASLLEISAPWGSATEPYEYVTTTGSEGQPTSLPILTLTLAIIRLLDTDSVYYYTQTITQSAPTALEFAPSETNAPHTIAPPQRSLWSQWNRGQHAAIILLAIVVVLALAGTSYKINWYVREIRKEKTRSRVHQALHETRKRALADVWRRRGRNEPAIHNAGLLTDNVENRIKRIGS